MLIHIPENLKNKIEFIFGDVKIIDNVKLTKKEQVEFEEFQEFVRYRFKHRLD